MMKEEKEDGQKGKASPVNRNSIQYDGNCKRIRGVLQQVGNGFNAGSNGNRNPERKSSTAGTA
jgi:hypothetical protein